jgi:GDP-L-fucose synthase
LLSEESLVVGPPAPVSGYAWSKLTDELLAKWTQASGGPEVVIGRFANIYGPGGSFDSARSTVVHALVRKAIEARDRRLEVWGDGSAVRSFLHVEDAARAIVAILERGEAGGTYNCDAQEPVTITELAGIVRDAVDPSLEPVFDSSRASGPARRVLDTTRLRSLGFSADVALVAGVTGVVKAYSHKTDLSPRGASA